MRRSLASPSGLGRVPGTNRLAVSAVALSAVLLLAVHLTPDQTNAATLLNRDRRVAHVANLAPHDAATRKAQAWAQHLASLPYSGGAPALVHSRLTDGFRGVCYRSIGENVGTISVSKGLGGLERSFMASTVHRTNILNRKWNRVGTGVVRTKDKKWIIEVQVFVTAC